MPLPKWLLPLQASVDSTSIWELLIKFLAAFKVKYFKCISLLHFTPSISIPYKAFPPKVFLRSAHDYNSHTQGLSIHSDTIVIDKKVCFYRRLFANPMKPCWTNSDLVGPLGCINRVACGPKLFHLMFTLLMVWSGLLWAPVWPTVHTTWSPVSEGIVDPPTHPFICGIHDISGSVQNISQNQPVHPVAIQVSVMTAISLLYCWCKSYVATIKRKESIIHFIFQICISRNPGNWIWIWINYWTGSISCEGSVMKQNHWRNLKFEFKFPFQISAWISLNFKFQI